MGLLLGRVDAQCMLYVHFNKTLIIAATEGPGQVREYLGCMSV